MAISRRRSATAGIDSMNDVFVEVSAQFDVVRVAVSRVVLRDAAIGPDSDPGANRFEDFLLEETAP
jgi:hypothetical protein